MPMVRLRARGNGDFIQTTREPVDLMDLTRPPEWVRDALCAQVDTEIFFPRKGGSTREAKAVCALCPVRAECLDYALEHDIRDGIWGGKSVRERRKLQEKRTPTAWLKDVALAARVMDLTGQGLSARVIAEELGCPAWAVAKIREAQKRSAA